MTKSSAAELPGSSKVTAWPTMLAFWRWILRWQDRLAPALWATVGHQPPLAVYGFSSMLAVNPMPRRFGAGGCISSRMAERMAAMARGELRTLSA